MNVYEVFTKISMVNGISPVLAMISKEVLNLETGIGRLNKAFQSLNATSLLAGGSVALLAGGGIAFGLKKAADAAKELSHELTLIQNLGISSRQFEQAQAAAFAHTGKCRARRLSML